MLHFDWLRGMYPGVRFFLTPGVQSLDLKKNFKKDTTTPSIRYGSGSGRAQFGRQKRQEKSRNQARIQIRGSAKKQWQVWVNKVRGKNGLQQHGDEKFYDYSLMRAVKLYNITDEQFADAVKQYKTREGLFGFIKMLRMCGLHLEDLTSGAKAKVVETLLREVRVVKKTEIKTKKRKRKKNDKTNEEG